MEADMTKMTAAEVRAAAAKRHYEPKILDKADRGDIAEEIVAGILAPLGWEYCGGAWAGWDFEHRDGTRMQLKQAAALQTWEASKEIRPTRFNIKRQTGHWANGADWTPAPAPTRYAAIYIFAWHGVTDKKTCDHADPAGGSMWSRPRSCRTRTR
jgi:hypothetical protein